MKTFKQPSPDVHWSWGHDSVLEKKLYKELLKMHFLKILPTSSDSLF